MAAIKFVAGTVAATTVVPSTVEAILETEAMILGIPQSMMFVSLAGSLIGVLLLPDKEAKRANPSRRSHNKWRRLSQFITRWGSLAIFIIAWAILAGWFVSSIGHFIPAFQGAPQLPLAGIGGVVIRRFLPRFLQVVEKKTDAYGDQP